MTLLEVGNVSLSGLFVLAEEGFALTPGERVDVFLDLEDIEVRAPARVVRANEAGIAMTWLSTDPQIAENLTRLLEYIRSISDE